MRKSLRIASFATFFSIFFLSFLFGKIIIVGQFGNTYKISEPDPVVELQKIVKQKEPELKKKLFSLYRNRFQKIEGEVYSLPKANKKKMVVFDTTFVLSHDITIYDKNGNAYVYPAGTKYNILDFFSITPVYIVFNPNRIEEYNWVKKYSNENKNIFIKYILAGFPDNQTVADYIAQKPYVFLSKKLADFFQLEGTVAVIKSDAKEKKLKIFYYPIKSRRDK